MIKKITLAIKLFRTQTYYFILGDIENLYTPYLTFVKYLSSVWNAHSNVIAVELLNEPPMAG
eukprot:Pgem_evm1s8077